MRPRRLLIPLTLLLALGSASPAMAFDWPVEVVDFEFKPGPRKISVGDKVVWSFTAGGHTTKALRNQPDSWNSAKPGGEDNDADEVFEHTFTKPGRYQYVCTPHAPFMKSTIEVGDDAETDTVDNFKGVRRGNDVSIKFKLNEAAVVSYKLKGRSERTVRAKRLDAGRRSFKLKNLRKGEYRGTLTLVDDFDKKVTPKHFFVIR